MSQLATTRALCGTAPTRRTGQPASGNNRWAEAEFLHRHACPAVPLTGPSVFPTPGVLALCGFWLLAFGMGVLVAFQGDRSQMAPLAVGFRAAVVGAAMLWAALIHALLPVRARRPGELLLAVLLLAFAGFQVALIRDTLLATGPQQPLGVVFAASVLAVGWRLLRGRWR